MSSPMIAVGVDGSPASSAAVTWAAAEAVRRDDELVVIHAYDWRVLGARAQVAGTYAESARTRAEAVVEAAIAQARAAAPGVKVRGEASLGPASSALLTASADAHMVVVGSRGRGGFASLLLGSVSQQVATHAKGSVVVVRGRPSVQAGPIVVGVDGSPAADLALGIAFEEAGYRGTGVLAVRVYTPAHPPWGPDLPPQSEDPVQRRENEQQFLLQDVAAWREKYPETPIECVVVDGHAAEALIGLSSSAELVMVGMRGHGGFGGLLIGSVGLQLLHHAECPVLIARTAASAPPATT